MANESQQNINAGTDEISLKELILKIQEWWRYLLSKWLTILIVALLGAALGFTYAYFKKPIYTATTTFVLEEEKSGGGLGSLAGLASMAGVDIASGGGGIFQGDNILVLYKSRTMLEKTLLAKVELEGKKQLLIDRYIEFNNLREKWAEKPALRAIEFNTLQTRNPKIRTPNTRLQDSIMGAIVDDINKNYLNVSKPDKKLSIINAQVNATDELFAKVFNEEIVKNVNDFYVETKTKKSLANIAILKQKTDSVRAVMNGAIYSAVEVTDATPNLNLTRQVQRIAPIQKSQFSAETNKAILSTLVQNLEMSKVTLMKEAPLIQVIDQPILPLYKEKFGKSKGIMLGAILGIAIICSILIGKRLFTQTISN